MQVVESTAYRWTDIWLNWAAPSVGSELSLVFAGDDASIQQQEETEKLKVVPLCKLIAD